ncbi:MAG: penicillin-binding protein 2 [Planctomycetota bacterium]|nr:penicillin-binding protein 2 [Planctomycetota bacterium]
MLDRDQTPPFSLPLSGPSAADRGPEPSVTGAHAAPPPPCGVHSCGIPVPGEGRKTIRARMAILIAPLLLVFALLAVRLTRIHVLESEHWQETAEAQRRSIERKPAPRGELKDKNNVVLVQSLKRETVIADVEILKDPAAAARALAPLLALEESALAGRMERAAAARKDNRSGPRVIYLARNVEPETAEKIQALKIRGIALEDGFKRLYPQGPLACHLLGWAGIDGGKEGLELKLDGMLRGVPGYYTYERDAARRPISRGDGESYTPQAHAPRPGLNVTLTIDAGIQFVCEEELEKIVAQFHPKGATALAMDVRTGAIVAMANYPNFDPNQPGDSGYAERRNRAVTDMYEPGSTFKTFIAAVALEKGACRRNERFDCENGVWRVPWRTLHDSHAYGMLTFDEALVHSSNIWAAKVGMRMGLDGTYDLVRSFGFGERTQVDLPGESPGLVRPRKSWTKDSLLSVPMGQEICVTPLQLVNAYSAMVNGGVLLRPHVVEEIHSPRGETLYRMQPQAVRRVISPETSRAMREILVRVVEEGTGRNAWCKEYAIGGKTGTAQKVENGRYSHDKFVGSFCGFAPAEAPRLVCLVTVDEPERSKGYYGGTVAAPAVREILRRGLSALKVPERTPQEQAAAEKAFKFRRAGGGD